ncbi:MAG: CheR family methyltransferase [Afipia sp.]|nr:CheR family methyltransferase [Afipia sp.]
MPAALVNAATRRAKSASRTDRPARDAEETWLASIVELLRAKTEHDFTLYKPGTLQRRIERRRGLSGVETDGMESYLDLLRRDPCELNLLAKDLLIHVTSFFRDPEAFALLAETIIPELIAKHPMDQPLRIWIAGCSTGEETYSLAMLFREQIAAAGSDLRLQLFASDVDSEAVASAREGFYSNAIEADVSPARLARFFSKEGPDYRVLPDLRGMVVFTVQDVLADPPFSRLDMVSCRNLLIYLRPEAQAKIISLFHFALRDGGVLLLGSSETVGQNDGRFEVISKSQRLYRHAGRSRPTEAGFSFRPSDGVRAPSRAGQSPTQARQNALAELCQRTVMENHAPAAVLINADHECLYSLGPTGRYLHIAPGHPTHDLFAMAPEGLRTKLRAAIQKAMHRNLPVVVSGGRSGQGRTAHPFAVSARPLRYDGEPLFLICFIDEAKSERRPRPVEGGTAPRVAELEQELDATKAELQDAIRSLEMSSEEQRAVNEEALSVNEEFQSTNEELLTSKEELQSLNEELTALNGQLQETLERQRTTSDDLQNVLYSTDVATIFLDRDLRIRFFTPASKSLFNVIPGDIGRPLADLNSLAADGSLPVDAHTVLQTHAALERKIEGKNGVWFSRRIMPYRAHDQRVEGVVITFTDITEQKLAARALEKAKRQSEAANIAKSRFLAAASHDLRQPLQSLALLQGLLEKAVEGDKANRLVTRLGETVGAMSGMLNTLLVINRIEAGTVHAEIVDFPIDDLLARLRDEFGDHAQAQGLALNVVSCSLTIRSDPHLLEQMVRNLLSNALKYTKTGKVLLGCRRRDGKLSIEIWDTGIGIPDHELHAIFDEYHQLANTARQRSLGLGLGLSIVKRLGDLLGHVVTVRSSTGKGSAFMIEAECVCDTPDAAIDRPRKRAEFPSVAAHRTGTIMIIEDDPDLRDLLELLLKEDGHRTLAAPDGLSALAMVADGSAAPDLILSDYNLPNGMDGLQTAVKLRQQSDREIPVLILTGDISTETLRAIAIARCKHLNKPVEVKDVIQTIQTMLGLPASSRAAKPLRLTHVAADLNRPIIFVVDDDDQVRTALRSVLEDDGHSVAAYANCEGFLAAYRPGEGACLLVDAYLPGMSGLALLRHLNEQGHHLPAIMITGSSDVPMAVEAMKAGAVDFIEKPVSRNELLASLRRAVEQSRDESKRAAWRATAARNVAGLTPRQHQIMNLVLAGHPSKNIAADLGISQRTVENHRASIMRRTGTKSLPALARLALAAAPSEDVVAS